MRKTLCALGALTFFTATMIVGTAAGDEKNPAAPGGTPRAFERYVEKIPGTVVRFEMLPIPAGSIEYRIGKGEPQKAAVKRFWIGKTEVTWDELDIYRLGLDIPAKDEKERTLLLDKMIVAKTRPSRAYDDPARGFGTAGYPALSVTCHHARMYCEWLSEKTGRKYRLPTEVEWEYACRAGQPVGKLTEAELDAVAWWAKNSPTDDHILGSTHPVGTKKANAWGVHDMLGNAMEWCTGVDEKPVARGGSWKDEAGKVQQAARYTRIELLSATDPNVPKALFWHKDGDHIGFRVVCEE